MVGPALDEDLCDTPVEAARGSEKPASLHLDRSCSPGEIDVCDESSTEEGSEYSAVLRTPSVAPPSCQSRRTPELALCSSPGSRPLQPQRLLRAFSTGVIQDSASDSELSSRSLPRAISLPVWNTAVESEREPLRRPPSWAVLGIPRTVSDYFDRYRFARAHSEGLLFAHTEPDDFFADCRRPPRALSEGLCGGRIRLASAPQGEPEPAPLPRPTLEELEEGGDYEGKVLRIAPAGLIVDVGATRPGFLPRRRLRGIPRKLLQKGAVLSGLQIHCVDLKRKRFTLRLRSAIHDVSVAETSYASLMRHVAAWADVSLWDAKPSPPSPCDDMEVAEPEGSRETERCSVPALPNPPWPCQMSRSQRAWSFT